jgi:hypothetical protein
MSSSMLIRPLNAEMNEMYEPITLLYMAGRSGDVELHSCFISDGCSVDTHIAFEFGIRPNEFLSRMDIENEALVSVKPCMFAIRYTKLVQGNGNRESVLEYSVYCQRDNGKYVQLYSTSCAK